MIYITEMHGGKLVWNSLAVPATVKSERHPVSPLLNNGQEKPSSTFDKSIGVKIIGLNFMI